VTIHAADDPGRFIGWATPLMASRVHKNITAELTRAPARLPGTRLRQEHTSRTHAANCFTR
jgi:hypothetical protein